MSGKPQLFLFGFLWVFTKSGSCSSLNQKNIIFTLELINKNKYNVAQAKNIFVNLKYNLKKLVKYNF